MTVLADVKLTDMSFARNSIFSRWCWGLALLLANANWLCHVASAEPTISAAINAKDVDPPVLIRYPITENQPVYKEQFSYSGELIRLILERSGSEYELQAVPVKPMPIDRLTNKLLDNQFDYLIRHTDKGLEASLRAIPYPIYRGLVGWRIFFIQRNQQPVFRAITRAQDLKLFKAGVGYNWPDRGIMALHGFELRTAMDHAQLFDLLQHNRIDYFPRGINEIWAEIPVFTTEDMLVEQNLALHYPTAAYIFVSPENQRLAQVFSDGFENAIADGSFIQLFMRYFGEGIRRANLGQRKVFHLSNPELSEDTPLHRPELWFSPEELEPPAQRLP